MSSLQRKNIVTCIILSFVTCGFYGIYWLYCLVSDINTISDDPNAMSPVLVIILSFVTCGLYFLYWLYKAGSLLDQKMIETGRIAESRSVLYVILALFFLRTVTYALMQDTINKLAEADMSKPSF